MEGHQQIRSDGNGVRREGTEKRASSITSTAESNFRSVVFDSFGFPVKENALDSYKIYEGKAKKWTEHTEEAWSGVDLSSVSNGNVGQRIFVHLIKTKTRKSNMSFWNLVFLHI